MTRPSLAPKILARPRRRVQPDTLLDMRLDQLLCLFEQYVQSSERTHLEDYGCIVQTNEQLRRLIGVVEKSPALTANVVSLAVGERFGAALVEVGLRREPQQGQALKLRLVGAD